MTTKSYLEEPDYFAAGPICYSCEERVLLDPSNDYLQMTCPSCGYSEPTIPCDLFLVSGESGSGKSALASRLRERFPGMAALEMDVLLERAIENRAAWLSEWISLAYAIARCDVRVLLFGVLSPVEVRKVEHARLFRTIGVCNLDCSDAIRCQRLVARPSWRGWNPKLAEECCTAAAQLRRLDIPTFNTGVMTAAEVDEAVARWAGLAAK